MSLEQLEISCFFSHRQEIAFGGRTGARRPDTAVRGNVHVCLVGAIVAWIRISNMSAGREEGVRGAVVMVDLGVRAKREILDIMIGLIAVVPVVAE